MASLVDISEAIWVSISNDFSLRKATRTDSNESYAVLDTVMVVSFKTRRRSLYGSLIVYVAAAVALFAIVSDVAIVCSVVEALTFKGAV